MNEDQISLPDGVRLPFEPNSHAITPYFSHMSVLSVPDSETRGEPVYDLKEMVQLRFAGDRNYSPCCQSALNFDPLSASNIDPLGVAVSTCRPGAGPGCRGSASADGFALRL